MSEKNKRFNIRVYAIILNDRQQVLLSDEYVMGMKMTKFPGGGLKFGEGTHDCLHREALEEFGQDVEITDHFYTTDFYQKALFFDDQQLFSIYYLARFTGPIVFKVSNKPFDFEIQDGAQSFRWQDINTLYPEMLTFPVDQVVAGKIGDYFSSSL